MYIPLNVKTDYYLLNSLIKIDDLINFLRVNNIKTCGICDNNLSGSIEFINKCHKYNINPIIGLEIKYENDIICLYAKNYIGYKNLLKINSIKDNITINDLKKYKDEIICVLPYKSNNIFDILSFYSDLFIGFEKEEEKLKALDLTNNVIFFNEIRCFNKDDIKYLSYLNLLGSNIDIKNNNYFIKHESSVIFNKINIIIPKDKKYIPKYKENSFEFLNKLAEEGLKKRLKDNVSEIYKKRLNYELDIIKNMGFVDYFLIVYDYVLFAKKNNVLVGPGRGSSAGSLVCFAIGITDIDPIKYGLLFERFLNKDRITMPDIDIDFDSNKREIITNYVKEKYGEKRVALGLTYNTYKAKLLFRDLAKVLNINEDLISKFTKTFKDDNLKSNKENEKTNKYLKLYPELSKVYAIALKLENLKKNISIHAAGVVISSVDLDEVIPITNNNEKLLTGITMEFLEDLGLLKMDFLSLKNLNIISNVIEKIKINPLKNIDFNDEKVFEVFNKNHTEGIFQFDTYTLKKLLKKLKITSFNDLIASLALVRPGASDYIDSFVKRHDGKEKTSYLHPLLEDILKETYGIILYQEQVINILVKLANFTNSEADIVRRAISKKKDFLEYKEKFIKGCAYNNINQELANKIFDMILKFAFYGFNKSHSVAYAIVSYQMAYLKVYYKEEFINEILDKDTNVITSYLKELKEDNIVILKPNINLSSKSYILKNNKLLLPLNTIKGINDNIENFIINNRPYTDIYEFIFKNKKILNEEILIKLILSGSLDQFKINRKTLINNLEEIFNYVSLNDLNLTKPIIENYSEYMDKEKREQELNVYGFYIGNHPSSKYVDVVKLKDINNYLFKNVKIIVTIDYIKKIINKKNEEMAFIKISDETKEDEVVVFSNCMTYVNDLSLNDLVELQIKVSKSFDKISLIVNNIIKKD